MVVDRAVVRFFAPETGGRLTRASCCERTLALEARLEAMAENGGIGDGYQERDVRAALEHDVAEQMLASLAEKLIAESPAEKRPGLGEVPRVEEELGPALLERLGGTSARRRGGAGRAARRAPRSTRCSTGRRSRPGTSTAR